MIRLLLYVLVCTMFVARPAVSYADDFDFDDADYTISGDAMSDVIATDVFINDGLDGVNVSGFDIAGIMLGMSFEDIQNLFLRTGGLYAPVRGNMMVYSINPDWKYNLDYECRQQNIVVPSELEQCINSLARSRGLLYVSQLNLMRQNTGETIAVYFTSNATDNVVWRVIYANDVDELEGAAEKFENQRQKKILSFWQSVLDKYGAPNSGTDKWLTTSNAYDPMMTAYYGGLDLVDYGLNASDQAKNVNEARANFQPKPYAF